MNKPNWHNHSSSRLKEPRVYGIPYESIDKLDTKHSRVVRVLAVHNASPETPGLIYACLTCGSIGEVELNVPLELKNFEAARLHQRYNFDCCGPTVLFNTARS